MKKAISLFLAAVILCSILFIFPAASFADTDDCYDQYERCHHRALTSGAGVIKMTLMLTMCDISLGTCLFMNAFRKN